jgi:hypothetical protein
MAFRRDARTMTVQEYFATPEDGPRLEIIDGVVYDMAAAPSPKHQSPWAFSTRASALSCAAATWGASS